MHFPLQQRMHHWLARLLPSPCALCGITQEEAICRDCRAQFLAGARHRCRQCAVTLPDASAPVCGDCLNQNPAFDATLVAADYVPPIDQLVQGLKFGGRLALAPLFSGLLRDAMLHNREYAALPDVLTAVPLGGQRLAERGFNQALEIAKPLAHSLGIPLAPHLICRVRDTPAQSQLPLTERQANLREAFSVPPEAMSQMRGRHVGVVDDVITTGATLDELAATLKRFGAARVTNLIFARTP